MVSLIIVNFSVDWRSAQVVLRKQTGIFYYLSRTLNFFYIDACVIAILQTVPTKKKTDRAAPTKYNGLRYSGSSYDQLLEAIKSDSGVSLTTHTCGMLANVRIFFS